MHRASAVVVGIVLDGAMLLQGCLATNTDAHGAMKTEMQTASKNQVGALRPSHVRGDHAYLRPIQVTPVSSPSFAVGVNGLPVRVDLPIQQGMSVAVHVVSPLAFDGVARVDDVPLYVARTADVADGRVRVIAGMRVSSARTTAAGVRTDLAMAPGIVVRENLVAEDLLTLDFAPRSPGIVAGGAGGWRPSGSTVHLYPIAGGGTPVTIEVSSPLALVFERQGGERDGLLPVKASWSDGAILMGRVSLAELREIGSSETFPLGEVAESPPGLVDECGLRSTPPGVFRGVRRVLTGAVIYAGAGRGAWAHVTEPVDLEVEYTPQARYATILRAPGIVQLGEGCTELTHAWVETRVLSIPPGVR
jgi:hypothetical protein